MCQRFASHEAHAAEHFRGMDEELHGYRQLPASEGRVKAEALSAFCATEQKLQKRDDADITLRKELERKHADFVYEQQSANLLHVAVNRNEENSRFIHREGKKLHEEFTEYQLHAKKVNEELEANNALLHQRCEAESEQAMLWSMAAHDNLLRCTVQENSAAADRSVETELKEFRDAACEAVARLKKTNGEVGL